jgi:salicylate hydroxylase
VSNAVGRVVVVGAGIAGLTAAIALARTGFSVRLLERSERLADVGAGLQLSPNATRILAELDVLPRLSSVAVRPERVAIRKASDLRQLTHVPLGAAATKRWGSPYLTVHRADLQSALLAEMGRQPEIEFVTGAAVRDLALHRHGVTLSIDHGGAIREDHATLVVGADGVWSTLREQGSGSSGTRNTGHVAWRAMLRPGPASASTVAADEVTAFLHPGFHLVAYPVRRGEAINLVAVTRGIAGIGWNNEAGVEMLDAALDGTAPALRALLAEAGPWTTWPLHEAPMARPWTSSAGVALIGDAAHAMSPYAAQGAAMAIEDAAMIAALATRFRGDVTALVAAYERLRRPRIRRVASRGAFNRFTWHASGPVALVRDLVMAARPAAGNARDLDWLYGWTLEDEISRLG